MKEKRFLGQKTVFWRDSCLFLLFAVLGQIFGILERTLVPEYWISTGLDAYIPFLPVFVVPYLAWFLFVGLGLVILLFRDRETFVPTMLLLCSGMGVALLLFMLFPNGQHLRPRNVGAGGFAWVVKHVIYANDTNTNCCPSLHVLNQLAVCVGLCRSRLLDGRRGVKQWLWVFSLAVCLSTVFIKQHSVVDVVVAVLVFLPLKRVFFPLEAQRKHGRMVREY